MSINFSPSSWPKPADRISVRSWLMDGGEPEMLQNGYPTWVLAMMDGDPEAVDELMAAGADPTQRTEDGRGWLHWAADTQQPDWIILAGFQKLDKNWWLADKKGRTPFHMTTLSPIVAQAMGARWWSERKNWALLGRDNNHPEAVAEKAGARSLARVWRGWAKVCSG